jgi:peptidoglycan/xylan/chitin deacetylase (PgdA/CDA1 family)
MEIKQEQANSTSRRRTTFLVLLILVNAALVAGLWQYHRLIVEIYDGASSGFAVGRFGGEAANLAAHPVRIALVKSAYSAVAFGGNRDGYDRLIGRWQRFLDAEKLGYRTLDEVPVGADAEPYNLILLPSAMCMSAAQRAAVKEFLVRGKGVFMTWATGTRNEYGQWEAYSMLHEICGMDIVGAPPKSDNNMSIGMLSGGYPITAGLPPGFRLAITRFDEPLACHVREDRTKIDSVWMDVKAPSLEIYGVRHRAAIAHGNYLNGRFVWMGFTIGSGVDSPVQRAAFEDLLRNAIAWGAHQVQAMKPTWPERHACVLSLTQNILGPADVDPRIVAMARKHRAPVTSFVLPRVMVQHPEALALLAGLGEIAVLGDPEMDYEATSARKQESALKDARKVLMRASGVMPVGFRPAPGQGVSELTLDALSRAGYEYISTLRFDRMVPKVTRQHRRIPVVTAPRLFWTLPQMDYLPAAAARGGRENTMVAHFAQVRALGGYYCLAVQPSLTTTDFPGQIDALIEKAKRENVWIVTARDLERAWGSWDQIKIATRLLSRTKTSLKISNTGREAVADITVMLEMPRVLRQLNIESMTLGTALPDSMSSDGVRWNLNLKRLGAGKNVTYYIEVPSDAPVVPATRD